MINSLVYYLYRQFVGFRDDEFDKQFNPDNRKIIVYAIRAIMFLLAFTFEYAMILVFNKGYKITLMLSIIFGIMMMLINVEIEKKLFWSK